MTPETNHPADASSRQDALYQEFVDGSRAAIERLARGYESNEARRQDLVQEIHVALWRSFANFDEQCSMNTNPTRPELVDLRIGGKGYRRCGEP